MTRGMRGLMSNEINSRALVKLNMATCRDVAFLHFLRFYVVPSVKHEVSLTVVRRP